MVNISRCFCSQVLMHSLGHWRLEPGLHDLAFLPNIVQPASRLLVQGQQVGKIVIIIVNGIMMMITIIITILMMIIRWASAFGTTNCL